MTKLRRLAADPATVTGIVLVSLVLGLAILGPLVIPYGPTDISPRDRLQPPNLEHPLGTDQFGRDLLSRVASGARVSLVVGLLGTGIALLVGCILGAVAGYRGGWIDELVMRGTDVILALPYIVLAVAFLAVMGPGFVNVVIVIGITRMPGFARLMRSSVLALREQEFVEAARASGQSDFRLVLRHVLPNAVSPILVLATLSVATAINAEAALSFLGLGLRPPMPSWGILIADGRGYLRDAPWIALTPGIAISLTILGFNLLGDTLRDWIDVRLRND